MEVANSSSTIISNSNVTIISFDHPEWDDVLRTRNGTVKHPAMEINIHLVVDLCFIAWLGSPFNLKIVFRILGDKLLRRRPHYLIHLFTIFSCFCILLNNFFSVALFILRAKGKGVEMSAFCHYYVITSGWSYVSLLFNIFLSLVDSFVAVLFPMWHHRKLTPRRVVLALVALNASIGLVLNWQFVTGASPLRCAIQVDQAETIRTTEFVLFVSCIVFYCIDYLIAWKVIPAATPLGARGGPRPGGAARTPPPPQQQQQQGGGGGDEIELLDVVVTDGGGGGGGGEDFVFIHRPVANPAQPIDPLKSVLSSATTFRRVELESVRIFLFVISPFFLLPLPFVIYAFLYQLACPHLKMMSHLSDHQLVVSQQDSNNGGGAVCHDFSWLVPYFIPVLMSMYSLINPIMNLLLNNDFRSPDYLPAHLAGLDY